MKKVFWRLVCWKFLFLIQMKSSVNVNAHLGALDQAQNDDFYTAAVVEFSLPTTPNVVTGKPRRMIETSLDEYLRLINEAAKNNADIIVFPEGSLNYHGIATRQKLAKYAVELNETDIFNSTSFNNVCDYSDKSSIISKISFNSRKNQIYVLINVVERTSCQQNTKCNPSLYSTNLVFDRNGCIVSKYRKHNTKQDPILDSTSIPEVNIFHTDFDVSFGHFTSLDILSKYPAYIMLQHGIKHILYPTSWFSYLPFYTSLQIQQSFSYGNNIVLLASSANSPISGQGGSGIYIGRNGAIAMLLPPESTQQLILSRIPKDTETYSMHITDSVVKRYSLKQLDELLIKHIPLTFAVELPSNNEIRRFCSDKICCEFTMKYKKHEMKVNESFHYKVTVFSGKEKQINEHSKEIYCAVVACTSDSTKSCGTRFQPSDNLKPSVKFERIKIKMIVELETAQNDYLVMPTNVDFSILPLDTSQYNFERSAVYSNEDKQYINYTTILTSENESIMTFGVLGRVFQLDEIGEEDIPSLLYLLLTFFAGIFIIFLIMKKFRL